ncbi:MAG: putative drug exporter of the superfamily [Thermomicrobiales bacterium]|nr:putative drug exporter of the superfamily [Thermomicrobiales bacterium]
MNGLFSTAGLARSSARRPWLVVAAWVALLILAVVVQAVRPANTTTDVGLLNNPEAQQGWDLLEAHGIRAERGGTETLIVRSATLTVDDPAFRATVQRATDAFRADTDVVAGVVNYYELGAQDPETAAGLVSADRKTTIIPVTLVGSLDDAIGHGADVLALVHTLQDAAPDFAILTVGDGSLNEEVNSLAEADIARGESIGIGVALLILIVLFGALVAAFVPLILAVLSIVIAFGVAAVVSQFSEQTLATSAVIPMIGLAVGVDYALFVVERYREERRRGAAKHDAIAIAGGTASKAVLFSGMTVVLALLGMFIAPTNDFRSLSIGAILTVAVAVVATLTLIPAVISLLGDKLDWPRRRTYDAATAAKQAAWDRETIHGGVWGRISRVVMGKPVVGLVVAVGFLLLCASPYVHMNQGFNFASVLPDELESKAAYNILDAEFSAGRISPVEIVVEAPLGDPATEGAIAAIVQRLGEETTADGGPLYGPATLTRSADNEIALISVPMNLDPDAEAATDAVRRLRDEVIPPIAASLPAGRILTTGLSANNADFLDLLATYTPLIFAFVLGLSFLLLLVVFRSLVVAAKAILMNLLSVGAAYGLIVWVFQEGHLTGLFGFQQTDVIEAGLPLFMFSMLFGLSMDYHVFLLSRIREHFDRTHDNAEAVAVGLQQTAKLITGAALIMVAVFAGFASASLVFIQQLGFGLGVAILLDATVVRSILVPSAMALLGDRNWYLPRWLGWLPDLRVEGATAVPVVAPTDATPPVAAPAD